MLWGLCMYVMKAFNVGLKHLVSSFNISILNSRVLCFYLDVAIVYVLCRKFYFLAAEFSVWCFGGELVWAQDCYEISITMFCLLESCFAPRVAFYQLPTFRVEIMSSAMTCLPRQKKKTVAQQLLYIAWSCLGVACLPLAINLEEKKNITIRCLGVRILFSFFGNLQNVATISAPSNCNAVITDCLIWFFGQFRLGKRYTVTAAIHVFLFS